MAGDWIKMRTSLLTNPKVNGIARELEDSREVSKVLSTGFNGPMSEIVTRTVMRHVTVSSLLVIWGAANEHTKNGIFTNADLSDIDDMVGIPGFGDAMEMVGWAVYDEDNNCVSLPNFNEYNTSGHDRSANAKSGAERQREYRDRKKSQESDVTRDVTNDVTSNRREEKRREEQIHTQGELGIVLERRSENVEMIAEQDAPADVVAKRTSNPRGDAGADVREVFTYWQKTLGHESCKLDQKRQRAIKARFKDGYSVAELCRAVDGCKLSPYHMGDNDRRTAFNDIELICRDAAKTDKFIALTSSGTSGKPVKDWI